ncbi:MAG: signal peptide peptidase SppA [Candidatus Cloacimonadaceae bacterium]
MKLVKVLIVISLTLLITPLLSQNSGYSLELEQPVATSDGVLSPLVNPAALGFGNSSGLGWLHSWEDEDFDDHYWLIFNADKMSYVYEKQKDGTNIHTLASGSELTGPYLIPNLYAGSSYNWTNNKFSKGSYRSGLLYRPVNFASLAFTWDNQYKTVPSYKAGFGWRPFAQLKYWDEHRLEISADFDYAKNTDGDYELKQPIIRLQTELINGITVGGSYNLENYHFGLNFSLSARKLQLGMISQNIDEQSKGYSYAFLPSNSFLPLGNLNKKQWYSLPLGRQVVTYKAAQYKIGPFSIFDNKQTDIESLIRNIEKSKNDPEVEGLVFINKNFSSSLALKQELITAIEDYKVTGRPIVFYYDNMSNADYLFAAAVADKIYLNPHGAVDLKGIAISSPYLKDALEALGIEVINFRSHPYKTAGNMLSESTMPEEERREYERILTSLYSQMCNMVEIGRGDKLTQAVTDVIDNGPYYIADDALKAGLVDELVYETELKDKLKNDYKFNSIAKTLPDYMKYTWSHPKKSKIAVIYAQGNIVMGKGQAGKNIAHKTTTDLIRKARKSKEYKGIILRIDSGGGSAQASDIIHKEIELAKTENKKPVVVTMSGVAGSGGYYIACNADYIYANPATLTGSIGVIGLTLTAEEMFKKLHVNWSTVKKGRRSDFGSLIRKWTEDEKQIMERLIATSYQDFIEKVAAGRNKSVNEIDNVAQGKIWTGKEAIQIGLVDELGDMQDAVAKIKTLANIKNEVELVPVMSSEKGFQISVGMDARIPFMPEVYGSEVLQKYIKMFEKWQELESNKALYVSPYDLNALAEF